MNQLDDVNKDIAPATSSEKTARDRQIDALIDLLDASFEVALLLVPPHTRTALREKYDELQRLTAAERGKDA